MKQKIIAVTAALTVMWGSAANVLAAGVSVELNGENLKYTLVDPQLINDRVMVPIRETADFLGVVTEWFEDSSTMTFTKGDDVAVHTLNQNFIISNGKVVTYDTPSQSVDGRTLVPVRMLAEALGATVDWNDSDKKVIITSEEKPAPESTQTAAQPAAQQTSPAIVTAIPKSTTITSGEEISINVLASDTTDKIKITDGSATTLPEISAFYTTGPNRVFTVTYTPTAEAETTLTLVLSPYTASGSIGVPKSLAFTVEASDDYDSNSSSSSSTSALSSSGQTENVYISSVDLSSASINYGNSVTLKAVTTNGAVTVWIKDSYGNSFAETSSYTTDDYDRHVWSLTFSPTSTGSYYLYAKDSKGTEVSNHFSVTVNNGSSSSSSDTLSISNVNTSSSSVYSNSEVTVNITTTDVAESVWITDPYGSTLYETSSYSTSGSNRTWEIDIYPTTTGSYTVYARDSNNYEVSSSVNISVQ